MFDIPVVLLIFKRFDKIGLIIDRLREVKPQKVYIMGDGPRNQDEAETVQKCRQVTESCIDWDCEIITNYAPQNRGVYKNIGEGAKWVFEREQTAIFLEDDNLPAVSFFAYCREMLKRYKDNERVLWVCGTNYTPEEEYPNGESYAFTRHMLPCGWASWADKFLKYYDGELKGVDEPGVNQSIAANYVNKSFYRYDLQRWMGEYNRIKSGRLPISWDFQMAFSIRKNNLLGIIPCKNQITNIGVDENSIHGGSKKGNVMLKRFCDVESNELQFPLVHPEKIAFRADYEKSLNKIILPPKSMLIKGRIRKLLVKVFRLDNDVSISKSIKKVFSSKNK